MFSTKSYGLLQNFASTGCRGIVNNRLVSKPQGKLTVAMASSTPEGKGIIQNPPSQLKATGDLSCEVRFPGWSLMDFNTYRAALTEPWYLRVWRVPFVIDQAQELWNKTNLLQMHRFEKTHMTYHRCIAFERCVSVEEMNEASGLYPYDSGITVRLGLAKIGGTSNQFDSEVVATETGLKLFRNSLLWVCVDAETREVSKIPQWWVENFKPGLKPAKDFTPLRLNLPREHPEENLLHTSTLIVQPMDIDYYGHANNNTYLRYAMEGLLAAQLKNKLTNWTFQELENTIRRLELEFISDCVVGDYLKANVYKDSENDCKFYVNLMKDGVVIYAQSFLYDSKPNSKL